MWIFLVKMLFISAADTIAQPRAEYYKAGDVGVFALDVEIPPDTVPGKTVYTARSDGEKLYLLWVRPRPRLEQDPAPVVIDGLGVLGRFQGSGRARVEILGRDSGQLLAKPSVVASVDLELPSSDGGDPNLLQQWATAQARRYSGRVLDSPYTSYYQYWLLQAKQKYGLQDYWVGGLLGDRGERDRGPDLYAMTTGALAIQESLQLEEMTGRRTIPPDRNVPVSTLKGPSIRSHPFEEMIQGRTPVTFPVAALVPYDNYYCHFTSISKEIAASDLFRQWGASLLRALTVTARDSDLVSRYTNQLGIDLSILTRLFGDLIIGEIALTGGDPFLKEGTDIAVIIEVKSRKVFEAIMDRHVQAVLTAEPDVKVSERDYEGMTIKSVVTGGRSVSSHSVWLGDYKVYSNHVETLRLIIDTFAKKRKSMADNLDFRYMRTIFPATAQDEDGFIFLSDPFIRKLLSPRWKIEAQRRIICQNHLRMIANAATMYRTELRKQPSIATLIEQHYLNEGVTQCPDGGRYSLDQSGRGFCTTHNCLQYCTPISNIVLEAVAQVEADDYRQFVRRYNDYWSRYFDPIGLRLRLRDTIEVETCILPLIENSIYNQLRELAGGQQVQLHSNLLTDRTVASISSKLLFDSSKLESILGMGGLHLDMRRTVQECVGDNLSLNFYDSDVLFTFAEDRMSMFGGWIDLEEQLLIGLMASSINLPLYLVFDLKNEQMARIFIRRMLRIAQQLSARDRFSPLSSFAVEPYSSGQYKGHQIDTLVLQFFMVKFRLHYAIAPGRLIVSTKRYVLEEVLDSLVNLQPSGGPETAGNLQLNVRPRAFDKLRPVVTMGWQERMRKACLKNIEPVRVLVECYDATEQTLNETSMRVEGVTLRCPSAGQYHFDRDRSLVYCSVHGNNNHPRQPEEVRDNEGLLDFIARMTDFSVRLRFTEDGIMTRVQLKLEPKNVR
jgi:hypothetical protein